MESTRKRQTIADKKRLFSAEKQAGFSLVEAIIASAIMMIAITATYKAANGFLKATALKGTKRTGEQMVAGLSKAVKRDWEMRAKDKPTDNVQVSGCANGTSLCKNLDVVRVKADATGDVRISFQSVCKASTGDAVTQSQLPKLDFSKILAKAACFKSLACAAGTVPWVEIRKSDPAANLSYPAILMQGSAKIQPRGPIGMAMCSGKEGSALKVTFESFYIKNTDTNQLEVEFSKQEMVLVSEKEVDGLQLYSTGVQIK